MSASAMQQHIISLSPLLSYLVTDRACPIEEALRCLSPDDQTRVEALTALLGSEVAGTLVKQFSHQLYGQLYNFDVWLEPLAKCTFPAQLVELPRSAQEALLAASVALIGYYWAVQQAKATPPPGSWLRSAALWDTLTPEHQTELFSLARALGEKSSEGFFVKLSTRSPKDGLIMSHRRKQLRLDMGVSKNVSLCALGRGAKSLPKRLQGKVSNAFMSAAQSQTAAPMSAVQLAAEQEFERIAMRNHSGWGALDLLCSSQRICDDLSRAIELPPVFPCGPVGGKLHIIARPWIDIPPWAELRGFIVGRRLTALSQYFTSQHYEELWALRHVVPEAALKFVECTLGPAMPMENAVVDLAWLGSQFRVIELNPFGRSSGAALFNWHADHDVLFGVAPFECRIREL